MNVFKRALIQVRANIGKSILIFIIFLMTMSAVSATFMITRMYSKTLTEAFKDGSVPVLVAPEQEQTAFGAMGGYTEGQALTIEQYKELGQLDGVDSVVSTMTYTIKDDQLNLPENLKNSSNLYSFDVTFQTAPETIATSYSKDVYKFDYDKDAFKSELNAVIINDEVMEANDLNVGDKVTLDLNSSNSTQETNPDLQDQEFTIVGTYSAEPTQEMIDEETQNGEKYGYDPDVEFGYYKTSLIMTEAKGEEMAEVYKNDESAMYIDYLYKLESLDTKETFEKDAEALIGMPLDVEFNLYSDSENEMAESLSTVTFFKAIFTTVIKFVVVVIIVLLTVIITLFVRGRKKEIGILVALGESKRNIYTQLLIEQFIILVLAIIIEYPIMIMTLNSIAQENGFLSIGFDLLPFGQTLLAGIVIVGIITVIPAIYTLRVKPKKILL